MYNKKIGIISIILILILFNLSIATATDYTSYQNPYPDESGKKFTECMGHISINSFNETEDYYIVDVNYTTYIDVVASSMEVWIKDENNHLIATNQSYVHEKNNFEGMKQYRNTFIINKTEDGVPTRVCMEFHSDKEINVMYSDIIPYNNIS